MTSNDTGVQPNATISKTLLIKTIPTPNVTGFYSATKLSEDDIEIRMDASNCKYVKRQYLTQENVQIDLKPYAEMREEFESNEMRYSEQPLLISLKYLENLVLKDGFIKFSENKLFNVDIICHSTVLAELFMVHGDCQRRFSLLCTKYKGNIYMKGKKLLQRCKKESSFVIARHALLADNPTTDVNTNDPIAEKFVCVYNWKLCNLNLMYFSNVQGVDSDSEILPETDLSELKITTIQSTLPHKDKRILPKYRSPSWWCKAFLRCSDAIHVANINEVDVIDSIDTIGLSTFLQKYEKRWTKSSTERFSFLNLIIDFIKLRMMMVDCPLTVFEFEFNPKTQDTVHYKAHSGRNEFTFLTDQYINAVNDAVK